MRWPLALLLPAYFACAPPIIPGADRPPTPSPAVATPERGPDARAPGEPTTPTPAAPSPDARAGHREPLPAGLHYRVGVYSPCGNIDDASASEYCVAPTVAVVAGIYPTLEALEAALPQAESATLAPGYPLVAHTSSLGLVDLPNDERGLALVVGLFSSRAAAEPWRTEHAPNLATTLVRVDPKAPDDHSAPRVVRLIDSPVTAWTRGGSPSAATPVCKMAAGTRLLVDDDAVSYYSGVRVECPGGKPAWIRWQDTRLETVIRRTPTGSEALQLVSVECDQPWFERYRLEPGVALARRAVPGSDGC